MAKSGNRPPRSGQSKTSGNRPPRTERAAPPPPTPPANGGQGESAAERARERLAQQSLSGQKRQSASQRARAGSPAPQRSRAGGPASRRGSARSAPGHSTAKTAGIFGSALVVLAVLIIILVSVIGKSSNTKGAFGTQPAPASVASALYVQPSFFTAAGSNLTAAGPSLAAIHTLKGQPALTNGGKPFILYVGSEWCPYCGATRWPLAVALARFGAFKGLHITKSSLTDVDPGTPSLSFYGTTYTSKYIAFTGIEQCTDTPSTSQSQGTLECNGYTPLAPISAAYSKLFDKYDFPPYVSATPPTPGGIPFIDFANKYHEDGAFIDPSILQGLTHEQIAQSLGNPVASPAQTILVAANYYSAVICKLTNNQPSSVCSMPVVKQAARALKL
jgi:hypothetical protein